MKKIILSSLSALILSFSGSSLLIQISHKHHENTVLKNNKLFETTDLNVLNDDNTINYDKLQKLIDTNVIQNFIPKESSGFSANQQLILDKTNGIISDLKQNNITSSDESITYLKNNYSDFNDYYTNPEKGAKNLQDKINYQFFLNKAQDFDLYASDTYQDALNKMTKQIKSSYGSELDQHNFKLTLSDSSLENKTLFQDDNDGYIQDFINNNTSLKLSLITDDNSQDVTLRLANIQLNKDNSQDRKFMKEILNSYFSSTSFAKLNVKLSDNTNTIYKQIINKISTRFPNYNDFASLSLTSNNPTGKLLNTMAKDLIQNTAHINVSIESNSQTKTVPYYFSTSFNSLAMNEIINNFFLSGNMDNNALDLGLTTDNTFQSAIDKLNDSFRNLYSDDNFIVSAVENTDANKKLDTQYIPSQEFQNYTINCNISFSDSSTNYVIGTTKLTLNNVALGEQAQEVKDEFDRLHKILKETELCINVISSTALAISVVAAGLWVASFFTGGTLATYAANASVVALTLSLGGAAISLAYSTFNDKYGLILTHVMILKQMIVVCFTLCLLLSAVIQPMIVVLTASQLIFPLGGAVLSMLLVLYGWLSYYDKAPF